MSILHALWIPALWTCMLLVASLCMSCIEALATAHATSTRVRVNYGDYIISPSSANGGAHNFRIPSTMPCIECYITRAEVLVTHEDGSPATAETGTWLHHVILSNTGRMDTLCAGWRQGERFFAADNMMTALDLTEHGHVTAISDECDDGDGMLIQGEFEWPSSGTTRLTISVQYDYVSIAVADLEHVTPYWLDIRGCAHDDLVRDENSITSSFEDHSHRIHGASQIVKAISHVQEHGTTLELVRNAENACVLSPPTPAPMLVSQCLTEHVAKARHLPRCSFPLDVVANETWQLVARHADLTHQAQVKDRGTLDPTTGIAMLYVAHQSKRHAQEPHDPSHEATAWESWWIVNGFIAVLCLGTVVTIRYVAMSRPSRSNDDDETEGRGLGMVEPMEEETESLLAADEARLLEEGDGPSRLSRPTAASLEV